MKNTHARRPTLGVAIIAAIAAACFSPEGEEARLAAERAREARALQATGKAASPRDGTRLARAAP
jgi:hypothetical protein